VRRRRLRARLLLNNIDVHLLDDLATQPVVLVNVLRDCDVLVQILS
jgi:hypothetical protein